MSSRLICRTNTAQASWAASANALAYTVTTASAGQTLTCSSPSTNCTLDNLVCGEAYDILVTATDGTCISNYSAPFRQDAGTACLFFYLAYCRFVFLFPLFFPLVNTPLLSLFCQFHVLQQTSVQTYCVELMTWWSAGTPQCLLTTVLGLCRWLETLAPSPVTRAMPTVD